MNYPKLSIITPSFNQAKFLEKTILSVVNNNYPNLEFIIIDGGSTDGSIDIIKKYQAYISYWVSEPDQGQANAINKGIMQATGDWIAWQNSDDIYYPFCFRNFAIALHDNPLVDLIIGNMNLIDEEDNIIRKMKYVKPTYKSVLAEGMVLTNQAAFWKRNLHDRIGFMNENLDCGFDFDWFLRVLESSRLGASHINQEWGALRIHSETKTSQKQHVFLEEYKKILAGREVKSLEKFYYQLRRLSLMLNQGEFDYVLRGIFQRVFK